MKKAFLIILVFILGALAFAEDNETSNYLYKNERKVTKSWNIQEAISLGVATSNKLKGYYSLVVITFNRTKNIGTCYAIYCPKKEDALSLLYELESTNGHKTTYEEYLDNLIQDNNKFEFYDESLEVENNAILSVKGYTYDSSR